MTGKTIVVDHGALSAASHKLGTLADGMDGQAGSLSDASSALLGAWEGDGRGSFSTASDTLVRFTRAAARILRAESGSIAKSNETYREADDKAASSMKPE